MGELDLNYFLPATRCCYVCKEFKEETTENFYKNGNGFAYECKPCSANIQKENRRKSREKKKTKREDPLAWMNG